MESIKKAERDVWVNTDKNEIVIQYHYRSLRRYKLTFWPMVILVSLSPIGLLLLVMAWGTRSEPGAEGIFLVLLVLSLLFTGVLIFLYRWQRAMQVGQLVISESGVEKDGVLYPVSDIQAVGWGEDGFFASSSGWVNITFGHRQVPILTGIHRDAAPHAHELLRNAIEQVKHGVKPE